MPIWLVSDDLAAAQVDDLVCSFRHGLVVRHHDDGQPIGVKLGKHIENLATCLLVEVAGWLVSEKDAWTVDQCSGDSNPLSLPTRQFPRAMLPSIFEAELAQQFLRPIFRITAVVLAADHRWQQSVFVHRQFGEQVVKLEDESDRSVSVPVQATAAAGPDGLSAVEDIAAFWIRSIESAEQMQQR
jgi:hypothetical protein